MIATITVFSLTLLCCFTDIPGRKIRNWTTYSAAAFGLLLSLTQSPRAFLQSLGLVCGLVLFGAMALKEGKGIFGVGVGDFKEIVALATLKGGSFALLISLYSLCFGAIIVVLSQAWNGNLWVIVKFAVSTAASIIHPTFPRPELTIELKKTPFALPIFLAVVYMLWQEYGSSLLLQFP